MGDKNLQELSRAYASRQIERIDYVEERTKLLDLLTGQTDVHTSVEPATADEPPHQPIDDEVPSLPSKIAISLIQLSLFIALVLGFFYFF